jgi:hypothetical protein
VITLLQNFSWGKNERSQVRACEVSTIARQLKMTSFDRLVKSTLRLLPTYPHIHVSFYTPVAFSIRCPLSLISASRLAFFTSESRGIVLPLSSHSHFFIIPSFSYESIRFQCTKTSHYPRELMLLHKWISAWYNW